MREPTRVPSPSVQFQDEAKPEFIVSSWPLKIGSAQGLAFKLLPPRVLIRRMCALGSLEVLQMQDYWPGPAVQKVGSISRGRNGPTSVLIFRVYLAFDIKSGITSNDICVDGQPVATSGLR